MRHEIEIVSQSLEEIKREFVHLNRHKISPEVREHLVALWSQFRAIHDEVVTIQKTLENPFLYPTAAAGEPSADTVELGLDLELATNGSTHGKGQQDDSQQLSQASAPSSPKVTQLPPKARQQGQQARVLIIDDCENTQNILEFTLSKKGFVIESLTDPTLAVERVMASPPDLILLDLMMPQMDGFEVLKKLRANPQCDGIQIIVGSSRSYDKDRLTVLGLGANDFIAKPYNVKELGLRIRNFLAQAAPLEGERQKRGA